MCRNDRSVFIPLLAVSLFVPASGVWAQTYDPGRLYGRVTTMDGNAVEGFIRWDQNEGHWTDALDASKRIPSRYYREVENLRGEDGERRRGVRILGFRMNWNNDDEPRTASSMIRLGHIRTIQVLDDRYALVTLKSGEEQEFRSSSTDFGRSGRGIFVRNGPAEEVELDWNDVDRIDLLDAPSDLDSFFGNRLYGTVETADGVEFTGWVAWDRDEIFGLDELDGDVDRQRQKIPFQEISVIERINANSSRVTLRSGQSLSLRGTNDVNDGNRGITVSDPGLGRVRIEWHEFSSVRFGEPPRSLPYGSFDGGRPLLGTVTTQDGRQLSGEIRWDNDEARSWEVLDGESEGIELDVELGLVESIRRKTMRSAEITLRDGRTFDMRGSNDVNEDNKGIIVRQANGDVVLIDWEDFARVVFAAPR